MDGKEMSATEKEAFRAGILGLCRAAFGAEWEPKGLPDAEFGPAFQSLPEQFRLLYELIGREPRLREAGYVDPVDYEGEAGVYPRHVFYRSRICTVRDGLMHCTEPSFYYDDNVQFAGLLRYLFPFWPDDPFIRDDFYGLWTIRPGCSGCIGRFARDEKSASHVLSGGLLAELGDTLSGFFPCVAALEPRTFRGMCVSDAARALGFTPVEGSEQAERSYAYDPRRGLLRFSISDSAKWTVFGMRPEAFQELESFAEVTWLKKEGVWCQVFLRNGIAPASFAEHLELFENLYYPHGHRRCTEEELDAAEKRLNFRFPEPLRLFYRYFGKSKKLLRASDRMYKHIDGDLLKLYPLSELQCSTNRERQGGKTAVSNDPILAYCYDKDEPEYREYCGDILKTRWLRLNRESGELYWDYLSRYNSPRGLPASLEDFLLEQLVDRAVLAMPYFRFFTVARDRKLSEVLSSHFLHSEHDRFGLLLNPERGVFGVGNVNWYFYARHKDELDRLEDEFGFLLHQRP